MTTTERWLEILNWPKWPHFDHIHDMDPASLKANYYISPELQEVLENIYSCLHTGRSISDRLLIGPPGSGKTTFIYYLMKVPDGKVREDIAERYHFAVLHINRVISASARSSEEAVIDRCLEIYRRYFVACDRSEDFKRILDHPGLSKRDMVNRCLDMIVGDHDGFKKRLIIIIDDIDEADQKTLEKLLRFMYAFMEPVTIQKWLVVRETSLASYHKKFNTFIRTKFPGKIPFPRVDLHGIVAKRIEACAPLGKNPFSPSLCGELSRAYNHDLREAMGVVSKFFEINSPGETKDSAAEEWIEFFFARALTKTLTQQKVFPNIYLRPRRTQLPMERDVFLLLSVRHTVDQAFVDNLNRYYTETVGSFLRRHELYGTGAVQVSLDEVRGVVRFLFDSGLVDQIDDDCFYPSPKGEVFLRLLNEEYYNQTCRRQSEANGKLLPLFWDLVEVDPDFSRTVL